MKTSDFDFHLPESLIAINPLERRDASRLLVLHPDGSIEHRRFPDIVEYMNAGDMLLLNKTKVLPVRLAGIKPTGAGLDITLVKDFGGGRWKILSRGKYTGPLTISERLSAWVEGGNIAALECSGDFMEALWEVGQMPLPPYIKRPAGDIDKVRYQTVYASEEGSIAAPTAGLHFTEELLQAIEDKGVLIRYLTLHVGTGTFTPIRADEVEKHSMGQEYFEIESALLEEISSMSGRLMTVGTTTTRAIEGISSERYTPLSNGRDTVKGMTDIFIYPGYGFRVVDRIITNFHLPRSTPLMLSSALAGRSKLLGAYAEAIREEYRFFSYGDAMLIL